MTEAAVANTSTYIQGRVNYSTSVSSSGITVSVQFQMRRTNDYSGSTYSTSAVPSICISGDSTNFGYVGSAGITVAGGKQNQWQNIYSASRTFDSSRSGDSIYVGWKVSNDNSGYLGGSKTQAITLPQAYTAPSTPTISASASGVNSVSVSYGISSYGNPSSGTIYLYGTASGSTTVVSSKLSAGDYSAFTHTGRTGNTRYYYRSRATNGQLWSSYSSEVSAVTLAPALSAKSASAASTTSITVSATTAADGGVYAKNIQYSLNNSTWTTGATVAAGTTAATAKSFTISGLTTGTAYTIYLRVNTSAGNTSSGSVSATTYKVPNNPTTSATNASATSNTVTYGTTGFNTPNSGTVYLYGGTAASPTTQLTTKTTTGNSNYTHSSLTGNTKYYYRSRAKNTGGWSSYSSDATAITRPAAPTLAVALAGGQKQKKVTLTITSPSQGSAATMTAYYTVNGGSATSAGTVGSGSSVTANITTLPQTTYTIVAYLSNSSGSSSTVTKTITTGLPLYCSVSGGRKTVKKLYCSVNGQAKLVQHLYGSVNGQAKKIF